MPINNLYGTRKKKKNSNKQRLTGGEGGPGAVEGDNSGVGSQTYTNNPKTIRDIFAIKDPGKREGTLNQTSYNAPTTTFKTDTIDRNKSSLGITTGNKTYSGTVSRNVSDRLGKGSGSFTQLDKGVGISAFAGGSNSNRETSPLIEAPSQFRRGVGDGIGGGSNIGQYVPNRVRSSDLNSKDPFKRAAANRQVKQNLAARAIDAKVHNANLAANTSRANTRDNLAQAGYEAELASKTSLRASLGTSAKDKLAQANKDRTNNLAERKFEYSQNKNLNEAIDKAVNLTSLGTIGPEEASPARKMSQLVRALTDNNGTKSDARGAIGQIYPGVIELLNRGISKASMTDAMLDELGIDPETAHNINQYIY